MREFLIAWLRREWRDYRERMTHVGRIGWNQRIIYQREEVRKVVAHLRRYNG